MLFTEHDLNIINPINLLDRAVYLTESESHINEEMIPIVENRRLNTYLTESAYDYIPNTTIILDESDIIEDPTIVNEYEDYVIRPQSVYSDEYQYVLECISTWIDNGYNDSLLINLLEDQYRYEYTAEGKAKRDNLYKQKMKLLDDIDSREDYDNRTYGAGLFRHIQGYVGDRLRRAGETDKPKKYSDLSNDEKGYLARQAAKRKMRQRMAGRMSSQEKNDLSAQIQADYDKQLEQIRSDPRLATRKVNLKRTDLEAFEKSERSKKQQELKRTKKIKPYTDSYDRAKTRLSKFSKAVADRPYDKRQGAIIQKLQARAKMAEERKNYAQLHNGEDIQKIVKNHNWNHGQPNDSEGYLQAKIKNDDQNAVLAKLRQERLKAKQDAKKAKEQEVIDKAKSSSPPQTPQPTKPNTPPPQQNTPKPQSNTPLEDKKGKPAEVKPNTPPPQQPPSKPQSTGSNNQNTNNKSGLKTWQKGAIGAGAAAAVGAGIYAYQQYKNKPRSVIAKRIAALRGIYRKFMVNAQRNPQKAGIFKRIAAKILSVIDKLMSFMQHAAN